MPGHPYQQQAQRPHGTYRYLIFMGNNSEVIRNTLQRRAWWRSAITDEPRVEYYRHKIMCDEACASSAYDLMWKQTLGIKLSSAAEPTTIHALAGPPSGVHRAVPQALNHFPSVKPIASKNGLFRSLQVYFCRLGMDVFDSVPTTFLLQASGGSAHAPSLLAGMQSLCAARTHIPSPLPSHFYSPEHNEA
jgi:hypothetical protein